MLINVLVCGGRDLDPNKVALFLRWNLRGKLADHYKQPFKIAKIIEGEAPGADTGARLFATGGGGYPFDPYPIDKADPRADTGPKRNLKMILDGKPDIVIAFPGHSGTADMVTKANSYNIPVIQITGEFH
jgi:hypothetical protein